MSDVEEPIPDLNDRSEVATYWSVGSFGPCPITIELGRAGLYVCPLKHDERGPFPNQPLTQEAIDFEFGCIDGGGVLPRNHGRL